MPNIVISSLRRLPVSPSNHLPVSPSLHLSVSPVSLHPPPTVHYGTAVDRYSEGSVGGPTVWFAQGGTSSAIVAGPLTHPKAQSSGCGALAGVVTGDDEADDDDDDDAAAAWSPGISATVQSLPAGFTTETLVHANEGGITSAMYGWGELYLRSAQAKPKIKDVTLEKIGYQTDNGAFYCTCTGNCSDKLLRVTSSLSEQGVPLGWLSFQGAGASSGNPPPHIPNAAPWCVDELGFDDPGGMGKNYPMPLGPFQKALGIPLQLYAPYVG